MPKVISADLRGELLTLLPAPSNSYRPSLGELARDLRVTEAAVILLLRQLQLRGLDVEFIQEQGRGTVVFVPQHAWGRVKLQAEKYLRRRGEDV